MSLYGTGRREGILATVALVAITALVHVLGAVLGVDATWRLDASAVGDGLRLATVPAVAAVTFYRFLKSLRRSRYASFLGAAAYALSPWVCVTAAMPREQLAAALAPLALEAACRTARPDDRRRWLPWTGLCIAAPFLAGITTVGVLAATIAVLRLTGGTIECRRDTDERSYGLALAALLGAALAATSLVLADAGASWLLTSSLPTSVEVLAAHRAPGLGLDVAAFVRLPGPVLLLFATLGLLRRQRHASSVGWAVVALCGAVPTVLVAVVPGLPELLTTMPRGASAIPAATFWLTLVAATVLGAAGLDDFLEAPTRRPKALPLLLGAVVVGMPALLLITRAPEREWPLVATLLTMALLLAGWRGIGMLRLKNVLGVVAIAALLVPAVQVLTVDARPTPDALPAAPAAELRLPGPDPTWEHLATRPAWHYAGASGALLWVLAVVLLRRRRRSASAAPARASRAMAKKAPPANRS